MAPPSKASDSLFSDFFAEPSRDFFRVRLIERENTIVRGQ